MVSRPRPAGQPVQLVPGPAVPPSSRRPQDSPRPGHRGQRASRQGPGRTAGPDAASVNTAHGAWPGNGVMEPGWSWALTSTHWFDWCAPVSACATSGIWRSSNVPKHRAPARTAAGPRPGPGEPRWRRRPGRRSTPPPGPGPGPRRCGAGASLPGRTKRRSRRHCSSPGWSRMGSTIDVSAVQPSVIPPPGVQLRVVAQHLADGSVEHPQPLTGGPGDVGRRHALVIGLPALAEPALLLGPLGGRLRH